MYGYQPGQQTTYQPPGRMDKGSGYGYQWDRNVDYSDKYRNGPLPEGIGSDPFEERLTCCRRCLGHPKSVGVVLILIGVFAILAQIVNMVLGAYLSYGAGGIWTGFVFVFSGAFGIAYHNKKTRRKLLIYTILSHISVLLGFILIGICMGGIMEDWELTDGCGGYSWRRWFDGECVEPQAKIGLHFTLASCALAGIVLSIYTSVGCWYQMGWCGKDAGIKKESTRVPYMWTGSLQRNGSLPRQHSAPAKPIYTGSQVASAKRPRQSTSSQKSVDTLDGEQLLTPSGFTPRQIPPQHFIIPYPNQEQYPDEEDQPFTPQPYMQHSTPTTRAPPMESDF